IQLWRNRLSRAADLPLHGEPALIANRPRRGNLAAQGLRQCCRLWNIFGCFDAAADGYDERRLSQIHSRLRLFEEIKRLGANLLRAHGYGHGIHGRFSRRMRRERSEEHTSELQSLAYWVC